MFIAWSQSGICLCIFTWVKIKKNEYALVQYSLTNLTQLCAKWPSVLKGSTITVWCTNLVFNISTLPCSTVDDDFLSEISFFYFIFSNGERTVNTTWTQCQLHQAKLRCPSFYTDIWNTTFAFTFTVLPCVLDLWCRCLRSLLLICSSPARVKV